MSQRAYFFPVGTPINAKIVDDDESTKAYALDADGVTQGVRLDGFLFDAEPMTVELDYLEDDE